MAKYKVQIRVQGSSNGYAAVEVPPYDSGSTAPKNEWRPWYEYYTFSPIEYADSSRFQIRPFIKWAIQITPNEFVTAEMLSDITGGRTSIESASPSFSPFSNVDKEYDADGQPVLTVRATVYFATGDPAVDPDPPPDEDEKQVTVTAINGSYGIEASPRGTVSVNGKSGTQQASDTGMARVDGTRGFFYVVSATPYEMFKFDHWDDGNTNPTRTGTANADVTFTAYFEPRRGQIDVALQLNVSDINRDVFQASRYHEEGEQITVSFTPSQGATCVRFRAAKKTESGDYVSLWIADGETTKTFSMPDADVVIAIACFYETVTVQPQLYTDGSAGGDGGSVTPDSASGKNGDTVSFTAAAAPDYELGTATDGGGYVWDWVGDIFTDGGKKSGNQSSATLQGNASSVLAPMGYPAWMMLEDIADKWFYKSSYSTPNVYFRRNTTRLLHVVANAHEYGSMCTVDITANGTDFGSNVGSFDILVAVPGGKDGMEVSVVLSANNAHFLYRASVTFVHRDESFMSRTNNAFAYSDPLKRHLRSYMTGISDGSNPPYQIVAILIEIGAWPDPTGQILYSPDNGGAIICGDGGKPLAQYVD